MFERFTDRARRTLVLAQEEARRLDQAFIGTEHVLLGLIRLGEGVALEVLHELDVSLDALRAKIEEDLMPSGASRTASPPFTPRAKKVLELGLREALAFGHNYIGTEHLLLGLITEGHGIAAQALTSLGVDAEAVRSEIAKRPLGSSEIRTRPVSSSGAIAPRCPNCATSLEGNLSFRSITAVAQKTGVTRSFDVAFCAICGQALRAAGDQGEPESQGA